MTIARTVRRFTHQPLLAVTVGVILVGLGAVAASLLASGQPPKNTPAFPGGRSLGTPYSLPTPATSLDRSQAAPAHRALHALGRACRAPVTSRDSETALRAVEVIARFARHHPDASFGIDDESGTTLSLLIVLRNELVSCAPGLVTRVDALIPPEYRP